MIGDILPQHVQCIFVRQPEQLGLRRYTLCKGVVGNEPFAVVLADDFIIGEGDGVTCSSC